MPAEYCTYCGLARGSRLSCCGENHFQTAQEFKDYHGEWPEDLTDEEIADIESPYVCAHCGGKGALIMQGGEWYHVGACNGR